MESGLLSGDAQSPMDAQGDALRNTQRRVSSLESSFARAQLQDTRLAFKHSANCIRAQAPEFRKFCHRVVSLARKVGLRAGEFSGVFCQRRWWFSRCLNSRLGIHPHRRPFNG
jgi:hypothetical protein